MKLTNAILAVLQGHEAMTRDELRTACAQKMGKWVPRTTAFDALCELEKTGLVKHYTDRSRHRRGRPNTLWVIAV